MGDRLAAMLPVVLAAGLAAGIGSAVLQLPAQSPGLREVVEGALPASGVSNPVTAVLLNFRGYDTFFEITLLALTIIGIWSLAVMPRRRAGAPGLVLQFVVKLLVPFMVLLGAYLVWAGSDAAGGAFQGGAVFAGALVLLLLGGAPMPARLAHWPLRLLLMIGVLVFGVAGLAAMSGGGAFMQWPPAMAGKLILGIELAAAISIGVTLAGALRGGRPETEP